MEDLTVVVRQLIAYPREASWFEFKESWFDPAALGEYVSALSNAAAMEGRRCGYLVWGVNDGAHEVVGTAFDYRVDVRREPLEHFLARQVTPDVAFSFHELSLDGRRVVVLVVPAASKVPTSFNGVRYLRIGSSKVNLAKYPERESQLFYTLRKGPATVANTPSDYQDLTFDKLLVYYTAKGVPLSARTFEKNLRLRCEDGRYNLLAQLLSDDSRIPVRFAMFNGPDKTSAMYAVREFGNTCLLYSLDKALEYGELLNVPQADERGRVVERKEVMLFDEGAFREAMVNAFVHNRWVSGNAPMITVFSDRIEILSRGTLPPEQTLEGFFAGESVPVNQELSDIFLQLHISERTGRGVPKGDGRVRQGHLRVQGELHRGHDPVQQARRWRCVRRCGRGPCPPGDPPRTWGNPPSDPPSDPPSRRGHRGAHPEVLQSAEKPGRDCRGARLQRPQDGAQAHAPLVGAGKARDDDPPCAEKPVPEVRHGALSPRRSSS